MIRPYTMLNVADNTGAKKVQCIRVLGGSQKKYATVGDEIVVTVKDATPDATAKKGEVYHAVVVRTKKEVRRPDGTYIKFDDNAVVLLNKQGGPLGTRVLGPVAREVRQKGFSRIASLAPEVV